MWTGVPSPDHPLPPLPSFCMGSGSLAYLPGWVAYLVVYRVLSGWCQSCLKCPMLLMELCFWLSGWCLCLISGLRLVLLARDWYSCRGMLVLYFLLVLFLSVIPSLASELIWGLVHPPL